MGGLRFTIGVWFDFVKRLGAHEPAAPPQWLQVGGRSVPLLVVRNPRARRYLLRLQADGSARVTIPRGGSRGEAESFVARNRDWLERQVTQFHAQPRLPSAWHIGTEIFLRGEKVRIEGEGAESVRMGSEVFRLGSTEGDLRPALERRLRALATKELPARVAELAAPHGLVVQRVTVRNQRRRWGSCSRRGGISLNWRLIQVQAFVRDYIIFHELAHLREMNHSQRFWREVERLCPDYRMAEKWLKTNRTLLR